MSLLDDFWKIEIVTLPTPDNKEQLVAALQTFYNSLSKKDFSALAWRMSRGYDTIDVSMVEPTAKDGNKLIKEVKVKVGASSSIDTAARAAVRLSAALQSAPVTFDFNGAKVAATSSDKPEDVVARWREDMEENSRRYEAERKAYFETPEGKAEIAAKNEAKKQEEAKLNRGWQVLSSLTEKDDDKVMEAIGLMADGYDNTTLAKPVPFDEVGKKLRALGYLPIGQIPQQVRDLANDDDGKTDGHKAAIAACVAGNYMNYAHPIAGHFAKQYFERFGAGPTRTGGKLISALPSAGNSSVAGGPNG